MAAQPATCTPPAAKKQGNAYREYVNPQWAKPLTLLGMHVEYERCAGCELFWTEALGRARRAAKF